MTWARRLENYIATGRVGRYFRLDGCGHRHQRRGARFFTEIRAGVAAFFAMSYILAVNASIVSTTGGTCVDRFSLDDPRYQACKTEMKWELITATAVISGLCSFAMGLLANLPVSLAPGMGLNAYFSYTVIGPDGRGPVPYSVALTAIFFEGVLFFILSVFGMRLWLAKILPRSIKMATGAGIGLFLTLLGLTYNEGIGLIMPGGPFTPLTLAGCVPAHVDPDTGMCPPGEVLRSPTMWVGIFVGGILTVFLMMYRVRGALLIGIGLVSLMSWPRDTSLTMFPRTTTGDMQFAYFSKIVTYQPMTHIFAVQQWDITAHAGPFGIALVSFLYVDILDCTGVLYSMAHFARLTHPQTGDFEGSAVAYLVDATAISLGALLGLPPVTAFIESGVGISEGGKTGLTAMTTGLCFLASLFFAPILASIPPWATGPILVLVGSMMIKAAAEINWKYIGDSVPAFVTLILMPFAYSVADGLIAGIALYVILNGAVWALDKVSGGRIVPPNIKDRDRWTWQLPGGLLPPWLRRLLAGKWHFWRAAQESEDPFPVFPNVGDVPDWMRVENSADNVASPARPPPAQRYPPMPGMPAIDHCHEDSFHSNFKGSARSVQRSEMNLDG